MRCFWGAQAKLIAKNFSMSFSLDDSGFSSPAFTSRTNLKLHNIHITPKFVRKFITNIDSWASLGPDCIPVVVLKKFEPELSHIAEFFNNCLQESCFQDFGKVSSMTPVLKNVGKRFTAKKYCPVTLLWFVSKVFEKLVNNRHLYHLEKSGIFSDFHYSFRSSQSAADILSVVSDRIAGAFNRFRTTRAVALGISKVFDKVWHASPLHKPNFYGISGWIFAFISCCFSKDGFG